uniref:non-specific serine/threonine protein kinase n=1 Tax=Steinernema glaseri TaxID=37863 RepID=A0A1I8AWR5_9BILA
MLSTSSRLRKRRIHATPTVIVDSARELEARRRIRTENLHLSAARTFAHTLDQNEQTHRRRRALKRRSDENESEEAAKQRALQQQEEMQQALERAMNVVAFEVESADTYRERCEEERKKLAEVRAQKAHNNMIEGCRILEEKISRKQKKPLTNDLIEDWVNFTALHTSRLATLAGSQLERPTVSGSSPSSLPQTTASSQSGEPEPTISEEFYQISGYSGTSDWLQKLLFVCRQKEVCFFGEADRDWQIERKLGEGTYGEVYRGLYKGRLVAMKNDSPDAYSSNDQFYLVMALGFAGQDLEHFKLRRLNEAASIITQLAFSLMIAEEELEFEHRDLHIGNVMVDYTDREVVSCTLGGAEYHIKTHGVRAIVIDFTISRIRKDRAEMFYDLESDPALFNGTGDYQFQVYRLMRQHNQMDWRKFSPYTNLLWLNYLMTKLLEMKPRIVRKFNAAKENMLTLGTSRRLELRVLITISSPLRNQKDGVGKKCRGTCWQEVPWDVGKKCRGKVAPRVCSVCEQQSFIFAFGRLVSQLLVKPPCSSS